MCIYVVLHTVVRKGTSGLRSGSKVPLSARYEASPFYSLEPRVLMHNQLYLVVNFTINSTPTVGGYFSQSHSEQYDMSSSFSQDLDFSNLFGPIAVVCSLALSSARIKVHTNLSDFCGRQHGICSAIHEKYYWSFL